MVHKDNWESSRAALKCHCPIIVTSNALRAEFIVCADRAFCLEAHVPLHRFPATATGLGIHSRGLNENRSIALGITKLQGCLWYWNSRLDRPCNARKIFLPSLNWQMILLERLSPLQQQEMTSCKYNNLPEPDIFKELGLINCAEEEQRLMQCHCIDCS